MLQFYIRSKNAIIFYIFDCLFVVYNVKIGIAYFLCYYLSKIVAIERNLNFIKI